MAVDMFLKLDGIKGEAKDATHKDEIDIYSFSWGLNQTGTFGTGGGGGAGKISLHDISCTKHADKSSLPLWLLCCNGKHIPNGTLVVRKAGETPLEFLKIKLTDILISSATTSSSGGSELTDESVSLNFSKIQIEYYEQQADGSGQKAGDMGWDVKANQKL